MPPKNSSTVIFLYLHDNIVFAFVIGFAVDKKNIYSAQNVKKNIQAETIILLWLSW